MKRFLIGLASIILLSVQAVPAQESLSYLLRVEGHSLEAGVLERLVELEMSPGWQTFFTDPANKEARVALAEVLKNFAMIGETEREIPLDRLRTGARLATLERFKGRLQLRMWLQFPPDPVSERGVLKSFGQVAEALEQRAGQAREFRLALKFDSHATALEKSALKERGASLFFVIPARHNWSSDTLDRLLRK